MAYVNHDFYADIVEARYFQSTMDHLSTWFGKHAVGPQRDIEEALGCARHLYAISDEEARALYRSDWSLLCADAFGAGDLDVTISL